MKKTYEKSITRSSVTLLNIDHNTGNSFDINVKDTINYQNNTIKNNQNNMIINKITVF